MEYIIIGFVLIFIGMWLAWFINKQNELEEWERNRK